MRIIILFILLISARLSAQTYSIDARVKIPEILTGHLKMGNPGPVGKEIQANSKYLTLGGKPVIPVMGEFHFSRYPSAQWEDIILKMKANGITIIATYVFWIHHEEVEGTFDWSGNKDFRSFIKLCAKHNIWIYPRIGPWCHGEVRNGATPDWIFTKKDLVDRSNNSMYQFYADRLYKNIAQQMEGLYYKDGGPIIGIQLENEYRRGPGGNAHILWLKQTAQKYGIDVPLYTVTGWGNASVPQDEVIPLFGGYPDEPWVTHIEKLADNPNFTFEAPMNDERIGADVAQKEGKNKTDYSRYPYLTCEIGVGNQISYHRRPILGKLDGLAIAMAKTGSGGNLPGYYVFAGGSNPVGLYTTLEENQEETGYWNEYPDISYDFQAAIRETGELAPSYHELKRFHYFLKEFGDRLAPMQPVIPTNQNGKENLQWALRVNGNSGFIFGMNYYRGYQKPLQKNVQFNINLPDETLTFPSKPVDIDDSAVFIWPFNFDMDGVELHYATAQPVCKIKDDKITNWIFVQTSTVVPEMHFNAKNIKTIETKAGEVNRENGHYLVKNLKPGMNCEITITTLQGKKQRILVLSHLEAHKIWLFEENEKKLLAISGNNLYLDNNRIELFGNNPELQFKVMGNNHRMAATTGKYVQKKEGVFTSYTATLPERKPQPILKKTEIFENAQWLKTNVAKITPKNELYHRVFSKELNLENSAEIKNATLYLFTDNIPTLRINRNWLNQRIVKSELNRLDVTGYLKNSNNTLLLDFPFTTNEGAFSAHLVVEYFNADRVEFSTDSTWLMADVYTVPATWVKLKNTKKPEIIASRTLDYTKFYVGSKNWDVKIPQNALEGLNNAYVSFEYTGDIGKCWLNHRLISDNFNNQTPWKMQLKPFLSELTNHSLLLEIQPIQPGYHIYFDKKPEESSLRISEIKCCNIEPEYRAVFTILP